MTWNIKWAFRDIKGLLKASFSETDILNFSDLHASYKSLSRVRRRAVLRRFKNWLQNELVCRGLPLPPKRRRQVVAAVAALLLGAAAPQGARADVIVNDGIDFLVTIMKDDSLSIECDSDGQVLTTVNQQPIRRNTLCSEVRFLTLKVATPNVDPVIDLSKVTTQEFKLLIEPVNIIGNSGNELVTGSEFGDRIFGGAGEDSLDGGPGNDTVTGGVGMDTLLGGLGSDILLGGDGMDTVTGGPGNDTLLGGDDTDTLDGGPSSDTLLGGSAGDTLFGGGGADTLLGGAGDDLLSNFPALGDMLTDGAGDDFMNGGVGNDLHQIQLINGANVRIHDDGQDQAVDSVEIEGTSTPERFDLLLEPAGSQKGEVTRSRISGADSAEVRFSNVEIVKLSSGDEPGDKGDVITVQVVDGEGANAAIDLFIDAGKPSQRPGR